MPTPRSPLFAHSLIHSLICLLHPYSVTMVVSSIMPNSTPSPPHTAYTFAFRVHTPPNKMVKLSVLYVQLMTSCVLSYFKLVYRLVFGSKLFITSLTSLITSPPKPLVRPPHTFLFITCTLTTYLFVFLVVFATQTPHPLCLTNLRPGLVLVFFLVIHLIIRAIAAWTLPLSASSFLTMLFSLCLAAASLCCHLRVSRRCSFYRRSSGCPAHPYGSALAGSLRAALADALARASHA
jgi:hypothetical protein